MDSRLMTLDRRMPHARVRSGNTLVLVTAILVLLVIIATAFLVRSQSGRAQAAAQQKAAGRGHRVASVAESIAQEVADALFVKRVDSSSLPAQVTANQNTGLGGQPLFGEFLARSDYPRLPPEPLAVRYGVDYFDSVSNLNLGQVPGGDGFIDGYNFAPFSVIPFTNWPARYGLITGEGNPTGNPGFGDSRWLASTEPMRAMLTTQIQNPVAPAPPGPQVSLPFDPNWGNLALQNGAPILSPEGLGFSHWPHLSWIATAENGFRVCWNIASLEGVPVNAINQPPCDDLDFRFPGTKGGAPGSVDGELSLGTPYEQWLPFVAPREPALVGRDPRGYLILDAADWRARVLQWFNVGVTSFATVPPHAQMIRGIDQNGGNAPARRLDALPNFLQLGAFGNPADEFKLVTDADTALINAGYPVGCPTPRHLIGRTLADADGDGWTDSFWFAAPTSSDRSTRQLVAVRIIDNSSMINVNVASRFDRTNTIGQTPADVALVTRRESYASQTGSSNPAQQTTVADRAAWRDVAVGFLNARENDPEYRVNFSFRTPLPAPAPAPSLPASRLVYAVASNASGPTGGVDVGWEPVRWEGRRRQQASAAAGAEELYRPGLLRLMGLITEGAAGQDNGIIPLFDGSAQFGTAGSTAVWGDIFALTRPADRLTWFKAMANDGELIDPITATPIATLTPFGSDDEIELRASNGLNSPQTISRLETALNESASLTSTQVEFGQFLRSSRSREETSRFFAPDDVRVQDWRARAAWTPGAAFAPRSGAELLLDHRRKLTTISGARNDLLPPRLWTLVDHSNNATELDVTRTASAYLRRGVDFNRDGQPDDVTGDGAVTLADDLSPYHPNIMFPAAAFIPPGANNPFGLPVRDTNGDNRIDVSDFENARQRFLVDNRKIDLRRPNDVPAGSVPATRVQIAEADRRYAVELQRVFRRSFLYDEGDRTTHASYFGRPGDTLTDADASMRATKLMTASLAANAIAWRDGRQRVTGNLFLDQPRHPLEAIRVPADAVPPGAPQLAQAGFIGVEKQPFLMEVFIAFVYPRSEVTQPELDAVTALDTTNCPQPPNGYQADPDPKRLPPQTINGAGEGFVTYDQDDPSTEPAVVFVAQIANPYNEPVSLADFELRINPASGAPQRFFFGIPGPAGTASGNTYGPDVQLGPCTPEEPRTAIVFSVPNTFPNGDPFPRDAWLDYLDIGAPIDADGDGILSVTESNLTDDSIPGGVIGTPQVFVADANALFEPAWGALSQANRRRGTLLFDATRTATFPLGLESNGGIRRWRPNQNVGGATPPGNSYVELRRAIYPSTGASPTWTVVDRFENEFEPVQSGQAGQRFVDRVVRLLSPTSGGSLPPIKEIVCRPGGLAISGIRLRQEGEYFMAWARAARQWLWDTQARQPAGTPGQGIISMDERTPRYAFSRITGSSSTSRQDLESFTGAVQQIPAPRGEVFGLSSPPDRVYAGTGEFTRWPTGENYFSVWGEQRRGKPHFFPTRTLERGGFRVYNHPAWRLAPGTNLNTLGIDVISYGEKGVTEQRFVDGTDARNFRAPLRLFQKDADFDHVAEILDVPMWGPLVAMDTTGRTYATLPEILVQGASSTSAIQFPKHPRQAPIAGLTLPEFGPDQAAWNRIRIDPAQYDTVAQAGGRPNMINGIQTLPPPVDPTVAASQQNGQGFNSRLPGGAVLLDAFTVDDRGASPFDANLDGTITFAERAAAEDRRLRLARNYEGKLTPGLINVNTAPVEVMRAMPNMLRLGYDDDFPIRATAESDSVNLANPATPLGRRRALKDGLRPPLLQYGPFDLLQEEGGNPDPQQFQSISFDYGAPVPRVRVAEAIDLWRSKGNVTPDLTNSFWFNMPSYFSRGLDLPVDQNHREWGPGMRAERGIDSLGELALLSRGAEFAPPGVGDSADAGTFPDVQEIACNLVSDVNRNGVNDAVDPLGAVGNSWNQAVGWSVRAAGLDPFRTRWDDPRAGAGALAPVDGSGPVLGTVTSGLLYRTEGIPTTAGLQRFPLSGRTAIDKHLLLVGRDELIQPQPLPPTDRIFFDDPQTPEVTETGMFRYDLTSGDAMERNSLLKGISNIATTRSDVFTVWVRIRTIRQDTLTGQWNGMDPENIIDDSRYMMTVDRSSVDRPGESPRIVSFVKVPN